MHIPFSSMTDVELVRFVETTYLDALSRVELTELVVELVTRLRID